MVSTRGVVIGELVFIRFVSSEIDEDSHVSAGLFCAASQLCSNGLPQYEFDALSELRDWFDRHLESPSDHLPRTCRYELAVCWFKPTAREHLARAWEMITILERNDILIWTIKSRKAGHIYYEDDAQIFAVPSREMRIALRR